MPIENKDADEKVSYTVIQTVLEPRFGGGQLSPINIGEPRILEVPKAVYCDGGVCGVNGQSKLGVYAFVWVDNAETYIEDKCVDRGVDCTSRLDYMKRHYIAHEQGYVRPEADVELVTNNTSELVALLKAMRSLPKGWNGTIYSDSKIAIGRVFWNYKMAGVPARLLAYIKPCRERLGDVKPKLLDGHPTLEELHRGFGHRGNTVSKWNELCDDLCGDVKATKQELKLGVHLDRLVPHRYAQKRDIPRPPKTDHKGRKVLR